MKIFSSMNSTAGKISLPLSEDQKPNMEGQVVINTTPIYLGFGETYSQIGNGKVKEFNTNNLLDWDAKLSPSDAESLYTDMGVSLEALNDFFGRFDSIAHFIKKEGIGLLLEREFYSYHQI